MPGSSWKAVGSGWKLNWLFSLQTTSFDGFLTGNTDWESNWGWAGSRFLCLLLLTSRFDWRYNWMICRSLAVIWSDLTLASPCSSFSHVLPAAIRRETVNLVYGWRIVHKQTLLIFLRWILFWWAKVVCSLFISLFFKIIAACETFVVDDL